MSVSKFNLCQWIVGECKIHESDVSVDEMGDVLDTYESLFINMGFNPIVSVNPRTELPLLKITDNGKLKATLFFEVQ